MLVFIFLLVLVGPILGWITMAAAHDELVRRVEDQSTCPACHYDLKGVVAGNACPECGMLHADAKQHLLGGSGRALLVPLILLIVLLVSHAIPLFVTDDFDYGMAMVLLPATFVQVSLAASTSRAFRSRPLTRWCVLIPSWLAFLVQAAILAAYLLGAFQDPQPLPGPSMYVGSKADSFLLTSWTWSIAALAIAGWIQSITASRAFFSRWPLVGSVRTRGVKPASRAEF